MMFKAFLLICISAVVCECTYSNGYRGLDYGTPGYGYAGIGYGGPASLGSGSSYNPFGLFKNPYTYPLDIDSSFYGGYNSVLDPGFNSGYFNKGLYNAKPLGYAYGSDLGFYGNFGYPLKKK
ncbi:hypothetical protein JTE90_020427 [Oedothorax gibbosus]|uniref:Uncharacterized protein n=1 Tax=Oedothorax gibbosus TaxID=931172 RepID=A0AAV6UDQ9_9ARAC|nr:hypothetical protein JTE90_020427 [Oedothorax gibbosus]